MMSGFRLSLEPAPDAPMRFLRGDTDGNGASNLTDAVSLLAHLFLSGPALPCADAADADDDGQLALTDAVLALDFLFRGGPRPPAPSRQCGCDRTEDALGCDLEPACP
ncbi:MAG: hypothetical protein HY721_13775 [Planctomycetes bacterium]|nr:hypothetical protein [Planctomycetota bacterium]